MVLKVSKEKKFLKKRLVRLDCAACGLCYVLQVHSEVFKILLPSSHVCVSNSYEDFCRPSGNVA